MVADPGMSLQRNAASTEDGVIESLLHALYLAALRFQQGQEPHKQTEKSDNLCCGDSRNLGLLKFFFTSPEKPENNSELRLQRPRTLVIRRTVWSWVGRMRAC